MRIKFLQEVIRLTVVVCMLAHTKDAGKVRPMALRRSRVTVKMAIYVTWPPSYQHPSQCLPSQWCGSSYRTTMIKKIGYSVCVYEYGQITLESSFCIDTLKK